jgi:hypothetical protein
MEKKQNVAKQRYEKEQPPGYADKKNKEDPYGDVILWFQLLDYAKEQEIPIIFVTDDRKDDWWTQHQGKIISPRPELIQEMNNVAGVQFYMYSYEKFLDYAKKYLEFDVPSEVSEEVREVEKQQEIAKRKALVEDVIRRANTNIPDYGEWLANTDLDQFHSDLDRIGESIRDAMQSCTYNIPDYNELFAIGNAATITNLNIPGVGVNQILDEIMERRKQLLIDTTTQPFREMLERNIQSSIREMLERNIQSSIREMLERNTQSSIREMMEKINRPIQNLMNDMARIPSPSIYVPDYDLDNEPESPDDQSSDTEQDD